MTSPPIIPDTMKAVVLHQFAGAAGLATEEVPTPELAPRQLLVKMAASPINPSDLAFIQGEYSSRPQLPTRPGLEGSGTVVAAAPGMMGRYLAGKRVSFVGSPTSGAWAEYAAVSNRLALPLDDRVSFVEGAMAIVNPLTAVAMLEIAKSRGCRAVVNTAAAGALGRMIDKLMTTSGISVINVVRRPEQVADLKAAGARIVLDSSAPDFAATLKAMCRARDASLALDAIGGDLTGRLLNALVRGGSVIVYGGLGEEPHSRLDIGDLIFNEKDVSGFWLTTWLPTKNPVQILREWRKVQRLLGVSLGSAVQATFSLDDAAAAVTTYQSTMSAGKVLFAGHA